MMSKAMTAALERSKRVEESANEMLTELILVERGLSDIQEGFVIGRRLTPWEAERLQFIRLAITNAREILSQEATDAK